MRNFSFEIQLVNGQVQDFDGNTNEHLQKLDHILAKCPNHYAELVIEFEYFDGDPPDYVFANAYLIAHDHQSRPSIKIRPSLGQALFQAYPDKVEDAAPEGWDKVEGGFDESIQQLADTITEDPDIFEEI